MISNSVIGAEIGLLPKWSIIFHQRLVVDCISNSPLVSSGCLNEARERGCGRITSGGKLPLILPLLVSGKDYLNIYPSDHKQTNQKGVKY
jgi:hypothetical protein